MSDSLPSTPDLLLKHVDWLRALARSLVADAHLAEDVAQDALVRALEKPPRDGLRLRAWLRRVLQNVVHERGRSAARREHRERAGARGDALPATDELVGQLQVERRLSELLLQLEEPQRSTVLLRYYEDLPPREIARRQGLPLATVKSRLHRARNSFAERIEPFLN